MQLLGDELSFAARSPDNQPQSTTDPISGVREVLGPRRLTESGLEEAIARTEDIVMPRLRALSCGAELEVAGPELSDVMRLLLASNGEAVSIESVESLFNQLVDHAAGSAIAWRHPMAASQAALGLVVIREVMHHGGFSKVSLSRGSG